MMNKRETFQINVDSLALRLAKPGMVGQCAIANAIKYSIPSSTSIFVDTEKVRFSYAGWRREAVFIPDAVKGAIHANDLGTPLACFSFPLDTIAYAPVRPSPRKGVPIHTKPKEERKARATTCAERYTHLRVHGINRRMRVPE